MRDFKTEAEAKKLWCPHARTLSETDDGEDSVAYNRGGDNIECLASGCMFWRWSHQDTGPNEAPTGFCGAAGLPKYI